jgi:predicted nucleotidyltransferase
MRAVGLITEYNPFHNGHLHHLRQSKIAADAEVSVAVMSGNFLQRGEAALCDKWLRTDMALAAGVDLVVELPFVFACNSAPHFATGAVRALDAIGGIGQLCFGSEVGTLAPLQACAELLIEKSAEVERQSRKLLRQGTSYPAARAQIMRDMLADTNAAEALESPNNILGIEYLKALCQTDSAMSALTVRRMGAGYHDLHGEGSIASATGIRRMLKDGEAVGAYLPDSVAPTLRSAVAAERTAVPEHFLRILLARILRGAESLQGIYQVEHGLENRLFEVARTATSLEDLIEGIKVRQLTRTRVQRVLCQILNEVEQDIARQLLRQGPLYLHLLGCSKMGEQFLAASRKERRLPLVGNYSRIHNQLRRFYGRESEQYRLALEQLSLELRTSDNYALLQKGFSAKRQRDYYEPVRRSA